MGGGEGKRMGGLKRVQKDSGKRKTRRSRQQDGGPESDMDMDRGEGKGDEEGRKEDTENASVVMEFAILL